MMKKLLLASAAALALTAIPARADIMLDPHLSGTGDNVIADATFANSALGHLNGTHLDVVDYTGLTAGFTGAASGNDIKINNTVGLTIEVFDPTNTFEINTLTQVFSLKGTGDVHLSVVANDGTFTFDLGQIDANAQSGFTISALNGESIVSMTLLDIGGTITDFEHNRIDVSVAAVPEPATWAMMILGFAGVSIMGARRRRSTSNIRLV